MANTTEANNFQANNFQANNLQTNNNNFTLESLKLQIDEANKNMDVFFVLITSVIIFFMQCGFAFLEAGSVRTKNATNAVIKNTIQTMLAAVAFWALGYSFAYGEPSNAFVGFNWFFAINLPEARYHLWFGEFVFAATTAAIVSGALAERCEFAAYLIYTLFITGFIYPFIAHWAWAPTGWLNNLNYDDFAGSGVVHLTGGTCAFVGALLLGPRIGRFRNGIAQEIAGHSTPLAALGGFILLFSFFAFNGASQDEISQPGDGAVAARAMYNTALCGASSALMVMAFSMFTMKRWSLLQSINGALAGMVCAGAGCNVYYPWAAVFAGAVAGIVFLVVQGIVLRIIKIDDPLDAIAVHAGGGFWGLLAVKIFSFKEGIVYGVADGSRWLGLVENVIGAGAIIVWSGGWAFLLFGALKVFNLFRVREEVELKGLDIARHKDPAYPEFSQGTSYYRVEAPNTYSNFGTEELRKRPAATHTTQTEGPASIDSPQVANGSSPVGSTRALMYHQSYSSYSTPYATLPIHHRRY